MTVFGRDYASAYDALYRDKDYIKECDFIEHVFTKYGLKPNTILDLGCGTGGHALILAKRGYDVVGVDRSGKMLEVARRRAKADKLPIKFIKGDITSLSLNKKFDAVISMFAVMGYQTKNRKLAGACITAQQHLTAKGVFIFDCWHGTAVLTDKPSARMKEVSIGEKDAIKRFTKPIVNILNNTVEVNFKVQNIHNNKIINTTEESHLMRYIFPQEINYYLEVAGFSQVEIRPSYELGRKLSDKDWNMTVIAR
jgi:SAM-dependent methyltransferase